MPLVNSYHRSQLMMLSLEEKIESENIVRIVDAFGKSVNPSNGDFQASFWKRENNGDLLWQPKGNRKRLPFLYGSNHF